ncbi:hypothetical protein JY476_17255 [Serratia marcescens]|nr:hypothetical protein [Serratia marcescens]
MFFAPINVLRTAVVECQVGGLFHQPIQVVDDLFGTTVQLSPRLFIQFIGIVVGASGDIAFILEIVGELKYEITV